MKTGLDVAEINLRIEIEDKVEIDDFSSLSYVTFYFSRHILRIILLLLFNLGIIRQCLFMSIKGRLCKNIYSSIFNSSHTILFLSRDTYELVTKSVLFEADRDGVFR